MGHIGMCFVWKPDCIAVSIAWNAWFFKDAWKALPRSKVHNVCNMGYGRPDFCGRLSQYYDAEHMYEKAYR